MKYIDADKLKKEIEKLKIDFINFHPGTDLKLVKSYLGYRSYENVLSIIDSLQQEQPSEDLEKEIKRWWKEHLHLNPENQLWMDAHQSVVFARYFYELGKNSK